MFWMFWYCLFVSWVAGSRMAVLMDSVLSP